MCHDSEECVVLLHDHLHFGMIESSGFLLSMKKMYTQPWELRNAPESSCIAFNFSFHWKQEALKISTAYGQKIHQINLPSFNLLFQSFLYLLIAAFLLWDRMNWQKHFLDFLQNFINSFSGGITLAVSQVAFIPSEEIYDFHKSMILKVCGERSTFWIHLWWLIWGWYQSYCCFVKSVF